MECVGGKYQPTVNEYESRVTPCGTKYVGRSGIYGITIYPSEPAVHIMQGVLTAICATPTQCANDEEIIQYMIEVMKKISVAGVSMEQTF